MIVVRREDWEQRLIDALNGTADRLFQYGWHDCCKGAAYLMDAMTGIDFSDDFPRYNQRKKAFRIIARAGGFEAMLESIAEKYGLEEVRVSFARRGDPVLISAPRGQAAGIVDLTGKRVIIPAGRGWAFMPLSQASRAWHLG